MDYQNNLKWSHSPVRFDVKVIWYQLLVFVHIWQHVLVRWMVYCAGGAHHHERACAGEVLAGAPLYCRTLDLPIMSLTGFITLTCVAQKFFPRAPPPPHTHTHQHHFCPESRHSSAVWIDARINVAAARMILTQLFENKGSQNFYYNP